MGVRTWVLKEWAVTIAALARGQTILLLRKGGIREREFLVAARDILLYPTVSHQDPRWLKPVYARELEGVLAEPPAIACRAEITHCKTLASPDCLPALEPFLIWTEAFVQQRLAWEPERPLQVLLLRAYPFPDPILVRERPRGCRSWFELQLDIDPAVTAPHPALDEDRYQARAAAILERLDA